MKKSIHKLIIFTVITFIITLFVSMTPTLAKELTLEQLGRAIEKQDAKNNVESSYAYIIGKYVFTSNIKDFTTQDVMLAARSISNITDDDGEIASDPIYDKMAIQLIERTYGSDGITATGWKISSNLIGKTELSDKIDVTYIDYNYIKDEVTVDTDNLVEESMETLNQDLFTANTVNVEDGKITINVNKVNEPIYKGMGSGILASLSSLVAKDGVKSVDFSYTNDKGETVTTTVGKTIDIEALLEWFYQNCNTIFGKEKDIKTYDLVNKSFTVTINLDENKETSYVSEKNLLENETYTINFIGEKETVDTDILVNNAMAKVSNDLFTLSQLENGNVTVTVKDVDTKIFKGMNSGIIAALKELASNEDIESIIFGYNDVDFTLNNTTTEDEMIAWFEENSKSIFDKELTTDLTMNDIINKQFTVTINLQDYAQKANANPAQYTVKIEATKYNVTFDYNGADNPKDKTTVSVEDGKTVNKPDDPTKEGHIFDGWYTTDETKFEFTKPIKKDTELKAHWKLDIKEADYILDASNEDNGTFESEYDTDTSTVTVTITDPTKDLEDLKLADDIKALVEKEEVVSVTMTYNGNETTFTSQDESLDEEINTFLNKVISEDMTSRVKREVSDTNLKKLDEKEIGVKVVVKSDLDNEASETEEIDYTIKFEILTHTVKFNYNDDTTESKTVTVDNKGKVEETDDLKNPKRDGYRFDGWYKGQDKFTFEEEITENVELIAHWIKQHKVSFNDDITNTNETRLVDDNTKTEQKTLGNVDGRKFLGWFEEGSSELFDFETFITREYNFKAKWLETLTKAEEQEMQEASQKALDTIHKDVMDVSVVGNVINVVSHKKQDSKVGISLLGAGVKTALSEFLSTSSIESITLSFGQYSVPFTKKDVDDYETFAENFETLFEKATQISIYKLQWQQLSALISDVKIKINLKNGKAFNEGNGEYSFTLEILPTE